MTDVNPLRLPYLSSICCLLIFYLLLTCLLFVAYLSTICCLLVYYLFRTSSFRQSLQSKPFPCSNKSQKYVPKTARRCTTSLWRYTTSQQLLRAQDKLQRRLIWSSSSISLGRLLMINDHELLPYSHPILTPSSFHSHPSLHLTPFPNEPQPPNLSFTSPHPRQFSYYKACAELITVTMCYYLMDSKSRFAFTNREIASIIIRTITSNPSNDVACNAVSCLFVLSKRAHCRDFLTDAPLHTDMHLLKLSQSDDPKIKANCARTLKVGHVFQALTSLTPLTYPPHTHLSHNCSHIIALT